MKIVTIANQKGGVGKTTTAVTLAHGLALKKREVLLVDMDPQGQCAVALGVQQEDGLYRLLTNNPPLRDVVRSTGRAGLWLVPGDKRSASAQALLQFERAPLSTLATSLRRRWNGGSRPDYIIIDTPPAVAGPGGLQEQGIFAADLVIVPCAMDFLSTDGVVKVLATMETLAGQGWTGALLGILPTFYDEVTRESKAALSDLRAAFGEAVMEPIHRATVLRECAAAGRTIWEHDPRHRAAHEYGTLVLEVFGA